MQVPRTSSANVVQVPGTSNWLQTFVIPERFSTRTMEAIKSGLVTKGMRVEIIAAIAIQMMQYTMQPTSEVHCTCVSRFNSVEIIK